MGVRVVAGVSLSAPKQSSSSSNMFPSSAARRLIVLIRRASAVAAGGTNYRQPHAAQLPYHYYSSAPLARTPDPDTVSYLVASCGLTPAGAAAAVATHRFRICSSARADAVLALLRRHGFSDAHIARMLRVQPRLVCLDPYTIIRPKLDFLAALGIQVDAISRTDILHRSLDKYIAPRFEFLRGVLGSDANIRTAVSRLPYLLTYSTVIKLRTAMETLHQHGLSENATSKLLTFFPWTFSLTPSRIGAVCKELEALGLPITHSGFARCFCVISSLKRENWLRKVALYNRFGVSRSELLEAFKRQPTIMSYSSENIKKKLQFYLDYLKLEPSNVLEQPLLITYSLEKNILPRCAVLSVLMRAGKIARKIDLRIPLQINSKIFSDKYVVRYAENVPDVVKAYEGKIKLKGFRAEDV